MARTSPRKPEQSPNPVTQKVLRNSPVQLPLLATISPGKPRGRPRLHASNAARQKAHRIRQKRKVYHRDLRSDRETPHGFFADLDEEFHFTLDVCASQDNAKCARYFTAADDGLTQPWEGVCWMNPPYGRGVERWIRKAYESALQGATVVCLVKSTTETQWWQTYTPHAEIRYIKGRITFHGAKHRAPFSVCLVIFRPA